MTWTPILAFAVIAIIFGMGDIVASKTRGIVSSIITAIILLLIFGGGFNLLPPDLMQKAGLMSIIPAFGMALILVNVGTMLDINALKSEWKTVVVSLGGIAGVVLICSTVGAWLFGREQALVGIAPIAGGVAATMMLSEAAKEAGRPELGTFVAAILALQMLVGLPISSFCLRKEAQRFIREGGHKTELFKSDKRINLRIFPPTPKAFDIPSLHYARLGLAAVLAMLCSQVSGLGTGVTFLLSGIFLGAFGFLDRGALQKAGGEGLLLFVTYAYIVADFVNMTPARFGEMLLPVIGLLVLSAVGVIIIASIVGKLFGWSPFLSIALGLACMFGYPVTYAVAIEVAQGVTHGDDFSEAEKQRVTDHLLPKMLIAGVTSVSLASVLLAGVIAPMIAQ